MPYQSCFECFPILFVAFEIVNLYQKKTKFHMGKWPANFCRNDFLKSKLTEMDFSLEHANVVYEWPPYAEDAWFFLMMHSCVISQKNIFRMKWIYLSGWTDGTTTCLLFETSKFESLKWQRKHSRDQTFFYNFDWYSTWWTKKKDSRFLLIENQNIDPFGNSY